VVSILTGTHRFNPNRWLPSPSSSEKTPEALTPDARTAFHPFGVGARSCVGIHLARMEMRYAVAFFFRECRGARLGSKTTKESMEFENFFLIAPKGHACWIEMKE
jgi:cytochrome P450